MLVQDVPLLLCQGTQAGHAARGAGQGTSAQPVLVLHARGLPPSLPPGAKLLLERAGLSPRAPRPHLLRLVESCKVGGPLACVSALGGWAA